MIKMNLKIKNVECKIYNVSFTEQMKSWVLCTLLSHAVFQFAVGKFRSGGKPPGQQRWLIFNK